jgi:sporulation protein YlmC with PRC-barrel domain
MNKSQFLVAASILAILSPSTSYAEMESSNEVSSEAASTGNIEADAKNAMKDIKHDAKIIGSKIEAFFISEDVKVPAKKIIFDRVSSASGMIGAHVFNYKNERVGTVKDVIIDSRGNADMIVIADVELPGFDGKLVAYKYSDIVANNSGKVGGDVITNITEKNIDKASEFSYETKTGKSLVRYIPDGGYSVAKILTADVIDNATEKVGTVSDVYFKNGKADLIIIGFDELLGMGGHTAATAYGASKVLFDGDDLRIQLSTKQSASLMNYKNIVRK